MAHLGLQNYGMAMIRGLEVIADYLVHVSLPYVFVESDYGSLVNIVTHKAIVLLEMTKFVYETVRLANGVVW